MRKAVAAFALTLAIACVPALGALRANAAANDASAGYESIRPSLVKVWAFGRNGRPEQSGTGIVVDTNDRRSLVLTASHVVAGAAGIRIDVSRELHDLVAHVERTGPRDLTLLAIDRGGLHAARFAPRSHPVVEGNLVAVAGYVKNDELIGVVGQAPRILFPGTVSSRPDNGLYLELENVHIEEGLSGGAVFDPATGDVLGIVTALVALWSLVAPAGVADEWLIALLGVLVFISPWVMGFHSVAGIAWTAWVVGVVTFVVGASTMRDSRAAHGGAPIT